MNKQPVEYVKLPGFFEIPKYSRYAVSKKGLVLNKESDKFLKGSINPDGYVNIRLTDDVGQCLTWGRHRLLCYVFKNPGVDVSNLVVNHINTVKGDDRLDNLEWVTYQGNVEHAGALGITPKCVPISVRDVDTGKVTHFPSVIRCARFYGMTKDAVKYRVEAGERRVFPERKQYREMSIQTPWYVPVSIEKELLKNSTSKAILVREVFTNHEYGCDQIGLLAQKLGLAASTLSQWISKPNQPVLPGFVQIKWADDPTPWRAVGDPYIELTASSEQRCVKVVEEVSGEPKIFTSCASCAKEKGLSSTALNYRLQSQGTKVFSDGCRYGYYPW